MAGYTCLGKLRIKAEPEESSVSSTMSTKKLSVGDRVEWDTSQGSRENPEYLVQTEKSKKLAAHKPAELRKKSG